MVLTGGTSGIGRALTELFYREGRPLAVIGRNAGALARLEAECPGIRTYVCDLASRHGIEEASQRILAEHPGIGTLVNNAGVQYVRGLRDPEFDPESVERETAVNFLAPVRLTRFLLPALERGARDHGRAGIVNITSALALAPKHDAAVYCATKAALRNFTQGLRLQLRGTGIRVADVVLPLVDTPMTVGRGAGKMSPEAAAAAIMRGLQTERDEIFVGKTRWLPVLMRLSPGLVRAMMAKM